MKTWVIPVTWSVCSKVTVEADTLKEAMQKALNDSSIPLPDDSNYIDDSWELSMNDVEEIRSCYNKNQADEISNEIAEQVIQSQQCDESKNYSERELSERFDDVETIASFLAHIKKEKMTEPEPCKGYGHCCYYGDWDCDSCIAANKIYEYFNEKNKPVVVVKKEN